MKTNRTPEWKIEPMRKMWTRGEPMPSIRAQFEVSERTIRRYCGHLLRPKQGEFTVFQRQELLAKWRAA